MFLRSTALVYPHLHLLTLGETCRYVITENGESLTVTDPGLSCHVALLPQRLTRLGLSISSIKQVIVTNLDTDRVAGIPSLRQLAPYAQVIGTAPMHRYLSDEKNLRTMYELDRELTARLSLNLEIPQLSFDEYKRGMIIDKFVNDSDVVEVGNELTLRVVSTPGHREHSVAYLLLPHEFIIGDQTFGYFNGSKLATPGGDYDLLSACDSIRKFDNLDISGIGLPYGGALTGELVKKHLSSIVQNTNDLLAAVKEARSSGIAAEEIETQVKEGFFNGGSRDPIVLRALTETESAVWKQLNSIQ